MELFLKSFIGFVLIFVIQLLSKSKYYVLSALVPLFPSIALFSYYFVGSQGDIDKLSRTIIFGMLSLITYFSFLLALLILSKKMAIGFALFCSSLAGLGLPSFKYFFGKSLFIEKGRQRLILLWAPAVMPLSRSSHILIIIRS